MSRRIQREGLLCVVSFAVCLTSLTATHVVLAVFLGAHGWWVSALPVLVSSVITRRFFRWSERQDEIEAKRAEVDS